MHDGCTGPQAGGQAVADKVRLMGFAQMPMPRALDLTCSNCEREFEMRCFEAQCPGCGMVYAVTPCHAGDAGNVRAAGIGY